MTQNLHERFDRKETIKTSSDRAFCLVIAAALGVVGYLRLTHGKPHSVLFALAILLSLIGMIKPSFAAPLNRLWTNFGLVIARFTSPIVLALLYLLTIIPIGLVMRITGKRPLRLAFEPNASTYWIPRNTDVKPGGNMNHQF